MLLLLDVAAFLVWLYQAFKVWLVPGQRLSNVHDWMIMRQAHQLEILSWSFFFPSQIRSFILWTDPKKEVIFLCSSTMPNGVSFVKVMRSLWIIVLPLPCCFKFVECIIDDWRKFMGYSVWISFFCWVLVKVGQVILCNCAVWALLWVVWLERNEGIVDGGKHPLEELWVKLSFLASFWASIAQ